MTMVLGLDIGTTSTIGILLRLPDKILATASRPVSLRSPQIGWAEEDPAEWWENVRSIVPELLEKSGVQASDIMAIGDNILKGSLDRLRSETLVHVWVMMGARASIWGISSSHWHFPSGLSSWTTG